VGTIAPSLPRTNSREPSGSGSRSGAVSRATDGGVVVAPGLPTALDGGSDASTPGDAAGCGESSTRTAGTAAACGSSSNARYVARYETVAPPTRPRASRLEALLGSGLKVHVRSRASAPA